MNKQQLASKIWDSANKMRSKIEAHEYKDYILGFIFYKFLSDKEIKFLKENDFTLEEIQQLTEDDKEVVKFIQNGIGYFIAHKNLFSTWIEKGKDFDVSDVSDALSAFERLIGHNHKKVFDRVFHTLQTGLSKLGDSSPSRTKAISELIQLIKSIPMDGKQDYDVLGFIYEYLIGMFAANAGKKAGEFYTPHEVSLLMSDIVAEHLKDRNEIKVYDPTSGSGSLLINIGQSIANYIQGENKIKYYAQELKENTYNLTRMNLIMRNILVDNIVTRNADTLEDDWPYFEENDRLMTYNPLYVDAVVSNPPYSQKWDSSNKETDPRYARFGLAPKAKADFAFLLHDLFHLKPDGIMTIVLPHGVLFRGGEEGKIRKNLIEQNHIDAIIGLPANIFFGTSIPTVILVLKQKRTNRDILVIDASKGFVKVGNTNKLQASNIKKIVDAIINREEMNGFSQAISLEEIRKNDYNLNIPRYVDSSVSSESWDIYASMFGGMPKSEIDDLEIFWQTFPNLRTTLFSDDGTPYVKLVVEDIKRSIVNHQDVKNFIQNYNLSFGQLTTFLNQELIEKCSSINISKEKQIIGDYIFECLKSVALIDKYHAYQIFDDEWVKISVDLEIIQSEGFEATKQVNPNMVIKKKDGKEQEVQDGWVGHVIPFELVQEMLLKQETNELKQKEQQLLELTTNLEEIIESFTEEEKDSSVINDKNDAFVAAELNKAVKALDGNTHFEEDSFESKIIQANKLILEIKKLKTEVKTNMVALHMLTKATLENLNDEQVRGLLKQKWITRLVTKIIDLPDIMIGQFIAKIQSIVDKYTETYLDIATRIQETETAVSSLIDELVGNEFDMLGLQELQSLLKVEA